MKATPPPHLLGLPSEPRHCQQTAWALALLLPLPTVTFLCLTARGITPWHWRQWINSGVTTVS